MLGIVEIILPAAQEPRRFYASDVTHFLNFLASGFRLVSISEYRPDSLMTVIS
jgi:hypothetical protein